MSDRVYVAQLEAVNGYGYTSVHQSQWTAENRLLEIAERWHMPGKQDVHGFANFDDQPLIRSHGVSQLPIEE